MRKFYILFFPAGVTILEILTAHTIIQFFTISLQGVAIMILQYVVFDNPIIIANILPMILLMYLNSNNTMFFSKYEQVIGRGAYIQYVVI